jgi:ribosomal-protein-alanine N-acetyltransferase
VVTAGEAAGPLALGSLCRLGPADLADCVSLDRQSLGGLWTVEQWERELGESQRSVVGLREGAQLLALASGWLVVEELHITAVAVHPDHRQQGLGRRVLEALLLMAQRAGAERATLEVATTNGAARALYASAGFQEVAIRRSYYRNGDDAQIQFKRLTP